MDYLMEIPLADGQLVLVEVDPGEVSGDLVLASPQPGQIVARACQTLEEGLAEIEPAMRAVVNWVKKAAPDEYTVEFGIKLGVQTTVIIARGTAEVNFVVKLSWKK